MKSTESELGSMATYIHGYTIMNLGKVLLRVAARSHYYYAKQGKKNWGRLRVIFR